MHGLSGTPTGWGAGSGQWGRAASRGQVSVLLDLPTLRDPNPAQAHTRGRDPDHTPRLEARQEIRATGHSQQAGRRQELSAVPDGREWAELVGTKDSRYRCGQPTWKPGPLPAQWSQVDPGHLHHLRQVSPQGPQFPLCYHDGTGPEESVMETVNVRLHIRHFCCPCTLSRRSRWRWVTHIPHRLCRGLVAVLPGAEPCLPHPLSEPISHLLRWHMQKFSVEMWCVGRVRL